MRVETHNDERTIDEMQDLFTWCLDQFGHPGTEFGHTGTDPKSRWRYGKEPDFVGSTFCSGPFEVEWIDFYDVKDATMFLLRWA